MSSPPGLWLRLIAAQGAAWVWEQLTSSSPGSSESASRTGAEHALGVGGTAQISEQRDVQRDEEPRPTAGGLQRERGRRQRAMDAGREIVARRAPHPGVDAVGRGGVAPPDADQAGEGGRRDLKRDRGAHARG